MSDIQMASFLIITVINEQKVMWVTVGTAAECPSEHFTSFTSEKHTNTRSLWADDLCVWNTTEKTPAHAGPPTEKKLWYFIA